MHPAARAGGAHAGGRRGLERAQPLAGGLDVARLAEQACRTRVSLDGGCLRHAAHPRGRAAAEVEQVLPGDEAPRAADRERRGLVEQPLQSGAVATGLAALAEPVQGVGLLEGRERVELEPVAGEVGEDDLAATEAHLIARGRERELSPVLPVALELDEHGRHAGGGQPPLQRERLDRAEHVAKLRVAGPTEPPERADRERVVAPPAAQLGRGDPLPAQLAGERPEHSPPATGRGGPCPRRRGHGARCAERHLVRLGHRGVERADGAVAVDDDQLARSSGHRRGPQRSAGSATASMRLRYLIQLVPTPAIVPSCGSFQLGCGGCPPAASSALRRAGARFLRRRRRSGGCRGPARPRLQPVHVERRSRARRRARVER